MFPKADTKRLIKYQNAMRFCTSYLWYQQLSRYIQQGRNLVKASAFSSTIDKQGLADPASNTPMSIRATTIHLQSFIQPIPTITDPQAIANVLSSHFGPIQRIERTVGISNRKYVMKKTSSAIVYRLPMSKRRSSFMPATRALDRLTRSRPATL